MLCLHCDLISTLNITNIMWSLDVYFIAYNPCFGLNCASNDRRYLFTFIEFSFSVFCTVLKLGKNLTVGRIEWSVSRLH